jgi:hypothetical protein
LRLAPDLNNECGKVHGRRKILTQRARREEHRGHREEEGTKELMLTQGTVKSG